jgi:hypothetical protein
MSELKWYSIQMADGCSCERPASNLVDLVKEVNKFMRDHTYHEDEILAIDYLGDEWQATPMKEIQEDAEAGALVLHARKYFEENNNE